MYGPESGARARLSDDSRRASASRRPGTRAAMIHPRARSGPRREVPRNWRGAHLRAAGCLSLILSGAPSRARRKPRGDPTWGPRTGSAHAWSGQARSGLAGSPRGRWRCYGMPESGNGLRVKNLSVRPECDNGQQPLACLRHAQVQHKEQISEKCLDGHTLDMTTRFVQGAMHSTGATSNQNQSAAHWRQFWRSSQGFLPLRLLSEASS